MRRSALKDNGLLQYEINLASFSASNVLFSDVDVQIALPTRRTSTAADAPAPQKCLFSHYQQSSISLHDIFQTVSKVRFERKSSSSSFPLVLKCNWSRFLVNRYQESHRPLFVLHDGPPYANGKLHVGHALNKFLKDITVRYKLLSGHRVHFVPGWDCHGLPIELKAVNETATCSPAQIRQKAADLARKFVEIQKNSLIAWGLMGDWAKCYSTMERRFEAAEVRAFAELYSKGLVYRHLLPVHWSGCSKTALAESELEYNTHHISPSLYLKIRTCGLENVVPQKLSGSEKVFCVVWTTTPWTLPSNEAIAYDGKAMYALFKATPSGDFYVVIKQFTKQLVSLLSGQKVTKIAEFSGDKLLHCHYYHPIHSLNMNEHRLMPFIPSAHVEQAKGTGLVHCAPCHGKEDFELGQLFHLPLNLIVDEEARFSADIGHGLAGLSVMKEGNDKVLQLLEPMVMHLETLTHSYPYDWRTNTPVITRLSEQWFVDTAKLSTPAKEAYEKVNVIPASQKASMYPFISSRPSWCISRQRVWGVPIPVLFTLHNRSPIVDPEFVEYIANRVAESGSDFWFSEPLSQMVPSAFWKKWGLTAEQVIKSTDVFDVWFDSGLSWLCVLQGGYPANGDMTHSVADMYLEGQDQFRGWFSSSLLLSVALNGRAPYKTLVVHGFTSDSEGRKMSKSLGNVVSPEDLLAANNGCIDILRSWAASSGLDSKCTVGQKEMSQHASSYRALRNGLRFMLGNLHDFNPVAQLSILGRNLYPDSVNSLVLGLTNLVSNSVDGQYFRPVDLAILCWLSRLITNALDSYYPQFRFNTLFAELDRFMSRLSSIYISSVKDILYCDAADSIRRRSVQIVFWLVVEALKALICPLLPYLSEEVEQASRKQWSSFPDVTILKDLPSSLLERYSICTDHPNSYSNPADSDWLRCLCAMRKWSKFDTPANAVDTCHDLYLAVVNCSHPIASAHWSSSSVSPFNALEMRLTLSNPTAPDLERALQLLHPLGDRPMVDSDLCSIFRSASISWSLADQKIQPEQNRDVISVDYHGQWVIVNVEHTVKGSQCPRCRRHTKRPNEDVCSRCSEVLTGQGYSISATA
ncbi:unnamed protein product [Calicophoron daubneyi]|uniref:isoleucine--tRNA ligase n=1 Tax=Calicophoron daubneyi TaxID=300641 RepID=A0AAV2TBV0_CALDB